MTTKPFLILFDLDGVLADDSHRTHFALAKKWHDYFQGIPRDTVFLAGKALVEQYREYPEDQVEIQYLTGRRIDTYRNTKHWLEDNDFPNPDRVTMRGFADRDVLSKYKVGVIKNVLEGGHYSGVLLYDDDPEVVRLVNETFGEGTALQTPWYVKPTAMVKAALS